METGRTKKRTIKYKYWTKKETHLLKKFYPQTRVKDLIKLFPERTKETIVAKAMSLNLPSAKIWQKSENKIIQRDFSEAPIEKIMKLLPKRSKLAILAQGERLGLKRNTNKPRFEINENYFEKWSAKMAYILGFIFADGSIIKPKNKGYSDRLSFGVNIKDIDILKKIKRELSAGHSLSMNNNTDSVHFSIQSQKIANRLKALGVSYKKSCREGFKKKFPRIPKAYLRDFIRGVIDGDGTINFDKTRRYPTLGVCGKKHIITFIRDYFFTKFEAYSKIGHASKDGYYYNLFYIYYRSNTAKELIFHLYDKASLYLDRKFKLANQCKKIKIKKKLL
jgi:hypothetical protein